MQVHSRLDFLLGDTGPAAERIKQLYLAAKYKGDFKAAYDLLLRCHSKENLNAKMNLEALRDIIGRLKAPPFFVYPRKLRFGEIARGVAPETPTNALPVTFARFLKDRTRGEICRDIRQFTIRSRTNLSRLVRFLYQPGFKGPIIAGRCYIVVDDVVSSGALFASLRSHIVSGGGFVVGISALAHITGRNLRLRISERSLSELKMSFGPDIDTFWRDMFGHGIERLTEQEARYLLGRWRHEHLAIPAGEPLLEALMSDFKTIATAHGKFGA